MNIAVACDLNGYIGKDGMMPWHLPADLKRFRELTWGHPIIMGRRTHESIGRPLPGRRNIVLSSQPDYRTRDCETADTFTAAIELAADDDPEHIFVIGGETVYRQALPLARRVYLTRVLARHTGDTSFPTLEDGQWKETACEERPADERNPYDIRFTVLERVEGTLK